MAKVREFTLPPGRLFPNAPSGNVIEIELFGATGEFETGKTLLGLSIAPGVHPAGHPFAGKPRTLYLDLEKSGATYAGTGCERIDVPAEMVKLYGPKYTAKQQAEWFNAIPSRIKPGQYDVILADPVNDIESGEVDIVKANPTDYGYTKNQIDGSVALLMAATKAHWKKILMHFSTVCKCFYFTTHLRDEFKGGKPTGRRESRGKETLEELASLYLWLERLPDEKGAKPAEPSAVVKKNRLADTTVNEVGQLIVTPLLPPRIPVATIAAIRGYIANPPNYAKLGDSERIIEKPATEEDLLRLKLAASEADRDAAVARSNLVAQQQLSFAAIHAARQKVTVEVGPAEERTVPIANPVAVETEAKPEAVSVPAKPEEKPTPVVETAVTPAETAPVATPPASAPVSAPMANVDLFADRIVKLGYKTDETFRANITQCLSARNAMKFGDLHQTSQTELLDWLGNLVECQAYAEKLGFTPEKLGPWLKQKAGVERINLLRADTALNLLAAFKTEEARRNAAGK